MSDDIIQEIRQNYTISVDANTENRELAREDLEFLEGEQWPARIKAEREQDGRPCLVINRLPQHVDTVLGNQRMNRPGIKVRPANDAAQQDTADMLTGLIRHIEQASDATLAYDTAFEQAVAGGFGFFRLVTVWADDESFDQEIRIRPIFNSFSVYFDPNASNKITMEDAQWCLITYPMARSQFEAKYPDKTPTSLDDSTWTDSSLVIIGEYFKVTYEEKTLYLTKSGKVTDKEVKAYVQKRVIRIPRVFRYVVSGSDVLEPETMWPGRYIPIIPVWGKELYIEDKRVLRGIVRHAKDPQRMYNYWRSVATETVALAPRTPYIGTPKQFQGFERLWQSAHKRNYAYLPYNPDPMAANAKPSREQPATITSAFTNEALQSTDEIKATTGIFDASLGNRSNETSGKAILARQRQGDVSHYSYVDNLVRALRVCGRQLVDLIPKVYNTERVVRIIGEDGGETWAKLYEPYVDKKTGKTMYHDLGVGKYDVVVDTGPSYVTKRVEAAETMMELIRNVPQVGAVTMDIVAESLDWPNKKKFIERIEKTLPPELRDKDADEPPSQEEQAKAQQKQALMQLEMQKQQLEIAKTQAEVGKLQAEIEKLHADAQRIQADAKLKVEETKGEYLDNLDKTTNLTGQERPGNTMEEQP